MNHDAIDPFTCPKSEVDAAIVLAGEAGSAVHDPPLGKPTRLEHHLGAYCTAIAARPHEAEADPVIAAVRIVSIKDGGLVLIGDDYVLPAMVPQIRYSNAAPVVEIVRPHAGGNVDPPGYAAVEIDPRPLVPGETRVPECRPRRCVLEKSRIGAGDLRHRIPVTPARISGDESVRDEELVRPIVIEIPELRTPRPACVRHGALGDIAEPSRLVHLVEAKVVVLEQVPTRGDVGDECVEAAAIECVTERRRHAALRFALEARSGEHEATTTLVQIQLLGTVVVREIDIRPAISVEIRRRRGESPASAADTHLVGDILEFAATEVVEEKILPAVGGELEAVVHDLRSRQVPQVDVAPEVCGHI